MQISQQPRLGCCVNGMNRLRDNLKGFVESLDDSGAVQLTVEAGAGAFSLHILNRLQNVAEITYDTK